MSVVTFWNGTEEQVRKHIKCVGPSYANGNRT